MIRDLIYPDDARKLVDWLYHSLEYDAAFAVVGTALERVPKNGSAPDLSTGIRFGGQEADQAVKRDLEGLCARFSFVSMLGRFDWFSERLLLQRRVLEELKTPGSRMTGAKMWEILEKVAKETRNLSTAQVTLQLLVTHPTAELQARTDWVIGINRVRNCIVHNLGTVEMEDVKQFGTHLRAVRDSDTLKVKWLRAKFFADGKEITKFPYKAEASGKAEVRIEPKFEIIERDWKIGERIEITPLECQEVGWSLALLGSQVLTEFEDEMNKVVGRCAT